MSKIKNVATVTSYQEGSEPTKKLSIESHPILARHVIVIIDGYQLTVNSDELILAIENSTNIDPNIYKY